MVVDELHRTSRRIVRVVGDIGYNIAELRLAGSNKILLQILRVQPQTIQSRRGPHSVHQLDQAGRRSRRRCHHPFRRSPKFDDGLFEPTGYLDDAVQSRAGRPIECAQRSRNRGKRENDVPHLGVIRVQVGIE